MKQELKKMFIVVGLFFTFQILCIGLNALFSGKVVLGLILLVGGWIFNNMLYNKIEVKSDDNN